MNIETVDITPVGFAKDNPKAGENGAKAMAAAEQLKEIQRLKAEMLREIVEVYFGGIDGVQQALHRLLPDDATWRFTTSEVDNLAERYEALDREHDEAGEKLLRALSGR